MTPPYTAEKVYQRFQSGIEKSLKSKVSCSAEREDLMQDFYIRLMRVEHWHTIDNIAGYVQTIMNNLVLDYYRKTQLHNNEVFCEDSLISDNCTEKTFMHNRSLEQLQHCIDKQHTEKKDLLWRSKIHGQNYEQIAREKKRSVSWVEKSIAHILAQCKQALHKER
ncbi:sigma-70 family RNA polymerase sigma factor [Colwellia sp. D2M02]|uniref:RNA polymerase sigma-70 region 2 domain-containing protein n=1 Tax=Colwellia asteriadis TaxID=517723 RepID=A0ABN1L7A1_9GAMM|nr:sigma-70 family RNA polymerase sigma factor [Colwellia sp. D2M02]